jgi:hypothetical protein
MPKYNNRYEYTISRTSDSRKKEDEWLSEVERNLTKQAVQSKRVDQSMFEQINSIINGKSRYRNVQDAVEDMQRRSGFLDYINKKVAQMSEGDQKKETPTIFTQHPEIEMTFKNYIQDTNGTLGTPAIINHVKNIHRHDVSDDALWQENNLIAYVHQLNESAAKENPQEKSHELGRVDLNIGDADVDPANRDAWAGLLPATKSGV